MIKTSKQEHGRILIMNMLFLFTAFMVFPSVKAQDTAAMYKKKLPRKYVLGFLYENGYVFQTNPFVKGDNTEHVPINNYQAFSVRIMFQTTGKKPWHQLYGYPYWGFGVHVSDFYNPEEMGVPVALYAFLNAPFHRWNNWSLNYEIDFGITGNWRHFNPVNNQYNVAIGAGETVYIHIGADLTYYLSDRWEAALGVGLAHFSNGALKLPNFGLNTLSPRIEIRYKVHGDPVLKKHNIAPFKRLGSLEFSAFTGLKNVLFDSAQVNITTKYQGIYFPIFGFRTTFNYQISHKSKFGIGMAVSYDGSVNARVAVDKGELEVKDLPFSEKLRLSIYPSYELVMGPYSLLLQPGFYIFRKQFLHQVPVSYQRIGLKYTFTNHITVGISLRAYNLHVSDFIEWSVGYQLTKIKK